MRRAIKIAVIVLLGVIILGLLVKHENFLQVHYDTIEERNLERVSLFRVGIKESVKWRKGGYREQYREIFEMDPSADRWRSWPIRTTWLGTDRWRSPKTPYSLSLRTSTVRRIFERYEQDQSTKHARDAFRELDILLPGSAKLEDIDLEEYDSIKRAMSVGPTLQGLIARATKEATTSEDSGSEP